MFNNKYHYKIYIKVKFDLNLERMKLKIKKKWTEI